MSRVLLVFFSFLFAVTAYSQQLPNYTVREFTTENGLPSNGIKGLQWDETTGFLWIATEAGIVRYNGMEFKTYSDPGNSAISANRALFLVKNNEGKIYSVDEERNIFYVEKNRLKYKVRATDKQNNQDHFHFSINISDTLRASDKKITKYAIPFEKFIPIDDTSCYILSAFHLIYYSIHNNYEPDLSIGLKKTRRCFKIGDHIFITDTLDNFYELSPGNNQVIATNISDEFNKPFKFAGKDDMIFWENGMNNPILILGETAWLLYLEGAMIKAKMITNKVPRNSLIRWVQYSEKQHTLFIGTDSKGIMIITPNQVVSKRRDNTSFLERNSYYAQIELSNGSILTNEGHIIGDKPKEGIPIKSKFYRSVFQTNDSMLWYVAPGRTGGMLCNYNSKTKTNRNFEKTFIGEAVAMVESSGTTYIATDSGIGIVSSDSIHYLLKMNAAGPFSLQETSPGKLTFNNCTGLLQYDISGNRIDTLFLSGGKCIRAFWNYNGYYFLGTYGNGFYIYHNGKAKKMPLDKNNYLLYTHCFIPDDQGFCWISSNRGLFKVNIAEMINAYEKNVPNVYYHYLGRNNGMVMTELNGGCAPCAIRLKNGQLSFPSMDGLLQIDPAVASIVLPERGLYIDEMRVDNISVDPDSLKLKALPSSTNEIVFDLGYAGWSNRENIYIEYQLDDTLDWTPLNIAFPGTIRFNKLDPGVHNLRIRKMNGFGINNYSDLNIKFTIERHWYRQWWFFSLQAVLVLALFALFYKIRTRRFKKNAERLERLIAEKTKELQQKNEALEKNNTIKTRLISIISHDIITPLKFLAVAGKNLLNKRNVIPADLQEETIREMTNTSEELQSLSTNILNWIKYQNENRLLLKENIHVSELVKQVINIQNSLAKKKNLQLVNNVDPQVQVYQFYEPLKILIYNLVSNSIAFSEKGAIVISSQSEEKRVMIIVIDEGIGMKEEQIRHIMADQTIITSANVDNKKGHGLGFMIIKDLLKMMDASVTIKSTPGQGTAISINIPIS